MATSSDSYGNTTGVERLVGDIVVSRTFSTTTVPTLLQVELSIDDIGADLNVALSANGYSVPVSTSSDPQVHRWLEAINNFGAAALVLGTLPMTAIAPGLEDVGTNRMELYQAFFNRAITRIDEKKVRASKSPRGRLGAIMAGSQSDTDGNRKLPLFKRDADNFPSTRPFTE